MTDTMREKFEVWYAKQYPDPVPEYAIDEARIIKDNRWHVWQAAQADARALVGELVDALTHTKRDYEVSLHNSYAAEAIMGDSYPERMQNDINRKFVMMQLERINAALTKAQAFMEGK